MHACSANHHACHAARGCASAAAGSVVCLGSALAATTLLHLRGGARNASRLSKAGAGTSGNSSAVLQHMPATDTGGAGTNGTNVGVESNLTHTSKGKADRERRRRGQGGEHAAGVCRHPEGCTRSASFGEVTSETRLFCAAHKEAQHEDKKHKLCSMPGCRRQGAFQRADDKGQRVCAAHSDGPRVSVGVVMCTVEGCLVEASYALKVPIAHAHQVPTVNSITMPAHSTEVTIEHGHSTTLLQHTANDNTQPKRADARWCGEHHPAHAVAVRICVCSTEGCHALATHGQRGQATSVCALHRGVGFIDRRHKRCQYAPDAPDEHATETPNASCTRQPSYGDPGEGVARFCAHHRGPLHVDVRSRLCGAADCFLTASFGKPPVTLHRDTSLARMGDGELAVPRRGQRAPLFCKQHKLPGHINLKTIGSVSLGRRATVEPGAHAADDVATRKRRRGKIAERNEILWSDAFATVTLTRQMAPPRHSSAASYGEQPLLACVATPGDERGGGGGEGVREEEGCFGGGGEGLMEEDDVGDENGGRKVVGMRRSGPGELLWSDELSTIRLFQEAPVA